MCCCVCFGECASHESGGYLLLAKRLSICYALAMPEEVVRTRFAESRVGHLAGVLLALLWIASMSAVDAHAYSILPMVLGVGIVILLWGWATLCGQKMVRLPLVAWCSLAVGGYFFVRSWHSYAMIEAWRETSLVLVCAVFYIAGVYVGQRPGCRGVTTWLAVAILGNLIVWGVLHGVSGDALCLGRPNMSLSGPNSRHVSLFLYKNFAALFFALGGVVLLWRAVWGGRLSVGVGLLGALGGVSLVASFMCGSRIPWLVLPLAAGGGWIMWLVLRLYARKRIGMISVLVGVAMVVAVGIGLYDLLFGELLLYVMNGVDTHLRYMIWSQLCRLIPDVPMWGYGTGASQWEIVPFFQEWYTPNYAHNEYLQAWVDYGGVGVLLMVLVLLVHGVLGFLNVASEGIDTSRRIKIAMAWLVLLVLAAAAATDFVWHDAALATLSAFCCGVLVSPCPGVPWSERLWGRRWVAGRGPRVQPVKAQSWTGRFFLFVLAGGIWGGVWQMWTLTNQAWTAQWTYDAMVQKGASPQERRAFLGRVMQHYPDPAVMDHYASLPYTQTPDWSEMERLLQQALLANPKQMFTVVMLADVLGRQGKCREVEILLRRCYVGDGMDESCLTNWPSYYSINLLQWAQQEMCRGQWSRARSMFDYAFAVGHMMPNTAYRRGARQWTEGGSPARKAFVDMCKKDAAMLSAWGIAPDDAWQQPLEAGGKASLYRRWVHQEEIGATMHTFSGKIPGAP